MLVILDQVGKVLARKYFTQPIVVIKPFLSFSYVENKGILFGLPFTGTPLIIVNALAVIILLILILKYVNAKNNAAIIPPMLILAGAFGNLIDRLMNGFVRDFIEVGSWPVFNFADIFISVGCFLSIFYYQFIFIPSKTIFHAK